MDTKILSDIIDNLSRSSGMMTFTWDRITDCASTTVTINGKPEMGTTSRVWHAANGKPYVTMRGRKVDARTEPRADGQADDNLSDAGANGEWHYWTVPVSSIREIRAGGVFVAVP